MHTAEVPLRWRGDSCMLVVCNLPIVTVRTQLLAGSTRMCVSSAGAPSVAGPVLHAFAAWLKLSAGAGLDGADLAGHPLTKAAMEGLTSVDTFEDASDAVCELVMCTSVRGEPEQQMMPLVQLLVPAVSLDPTTVQHGAGFCLTCWRCVTDTWPICVMSWPCLHRMAYLSLHLPNTTYKPHLLTHRRNGRLCDVLCQSCIG